MSRTMRTKTKVPSVIGFKTKGLAPLIERWAEENKGVPFSELIRRGLRKELQPLAGKRYSHLIAASLAFSFFLFW